MKFINLVWLSCFLVLLCACDSPTTTAEGSHVQEEKGEDPGYYDYWFEQKKDESGEIPKGIIAKWAAHDKSRSMFSSSSNGTYYLGPEGVGGRTRAILVDADDNQRYFAGGVSGGIWRSDNAGIDWTPLDDQAPNMAVTSIAQNPLNTDELYYTTGEQLGNHASIDGMGVFKSTDGGLSFSPLASSSFMDKTFDIEHSLTHPSTIFVAGNRDVVGIQRSTDGGQTWVQLNTDYGLDILTATNFVLYATEFGLFRSSNGDGSSFTEITHPDFPSARQRVVLANNQTNPDIVYMAFSVNDLVHSLFKSTDGGLSWNELALPPATIFTQSGGYNILLGVHAVDPDKMVLGGVLAYASEDGGASWLPAISPYSSSVADGHCDYHGFATIPGQNDEILISNDGGVYRYNWNTIQTDFEDLNQSYHTMQFYEGYHEGVGLAALGGSQDNGTYRVGPSSSPISRSDGFSCFVDQSGSGLAYTSTQGGQLYRTTAYPSEATDSEYTGDIPSLNIHTPPPPGFDSYLTNIHSNLEDPITLFSTLFIVNPNDNNELFVRSMDKISRYNWDDAYGYYITPISDFSGSVSAMAIEDASDPTLYYVGRNGRLVRVDHATTATDESGSTVLTGSSPHVQNIGAVAIDPNDVSTIYIGYSSMDDDPRIYKVENATSNSPSWTSIAGNLPAALPVNSIALDPNNPSTNIFIGTDYGLYHTEDGGQTWVKETSIPNCPILDIKMRADRTLFVFTHGRGAWALEVGDFVSISGNIRREDNEGVGNVQLPYGAPATPASGNYMVNNLAPGMDYTVAPQKDINHANGVTTFDIIQIQRHILDIEPLDSPYKIIAADVTNDGSVTTFDLIFIRQVILGIASEFPNVDSWRFVDAAYNFPDPTNPFSSPFPESIDFVNLTANSLDNDFIGVKMGDVTLDADPVNFVDLGTEGFASLPPLELYLDDISLQAGQSVSVPVYVENFTNLAALQLSLTNDSPHLTIQSVQTGDVPGLGGNSSFVQSAQTNLSWYNPSGQNMSLSSSNARAFVLTLHANSYIAKLSDHLSLNTKTFVSKSFNQSGASGDVQLDFRSGSKKRSDEQASAAPTVPHRVWPSPFTDQLHFECELPKAQRLTFELFDLSGRKVYSQQLDGQAGANRHDAQLASLPAGTYVYRIEHQGSRMSGQVVKAN
ncbi:MAG: T9SS type A sorting domain-containing protein [Bacteroidota bacterium]